MPSENPARQDSYPLVCYACGALNRVPQGAVLSGGKCGKCSAPLATRKPVDIDSTIFERLWTHDKGRYVIDVWAPWCGPCRMMAPAYEQAAQTLADHIRLFKLNSDTHQDVAARLGIRGIPTLIAYQGGREIAKQAGAQTGDGLTQWIDSAFRA